MEEENDQRTSQNEDFRDVVTVFPPPPKGVSIWALNTSHAHIKIASLSLCEVACITSLFSAFWTIA